MSTITGGPLPLLTFSTGESQLRQEQRIYGLLLAAEKDRQ